MAKLLLFIILALTLQPADSGSERYLTWAAEEKLSWNDFMGDPDISTEMKAHTNSKLKFRWTCDNNKLNFTVSASFDRHTSWKKADVTDHLLAHEQLHFDITELYARKLRKAVLELENPCVLPGADLKALAKTFHIAWKEREEAYDMESDHSMDLVVQAEWAAMIAKELEALSAFAGKQE